MNEYNPADQQAGIAYAERVATERFACTGEQVSQTTRMLMGCAFEAGVAHGREVPAGWRLVPAKPTTDMCNAAAEATGYDDYHGSYVGYIAMLAAAPEYAAQEGQSHE